MHGCFSGMVYLESEWYTNMMLHVWLIGDCAFQYQLGMPVMHMYDLKLTPIGFILLSIIIQLDPTKFESKFLYYNIRKHVSVTDSACLFL